MQGYYLPRKIQGQIEARLADFPVVAVLGPRQCGKTTLVRETVGSLPGVVYLDLERPSDLNKLRDPELFFSLQRSQGTASLFCLDEIQRIPEIFPLLRSLADEERRNGQFLLLGSASRDLLRQTSETLAGRITYLELTPFLASEIPKDDPGAIPRLWFRGGFPRSFLAASDESSRAWRESFTRTFLERDIPQLGFNVPAATLHRLWRMLAHLHGQTLNSSQLGAALGVSHTTVRSYLDLLTQTFMVRLLEPFAANTKKRIVKSPKVYLRDSGILHSLLQIDSLDNVLAHPVCGTSWEGLVIENVIAALPGWQAGFYRTSDGAEIDLILERGRRRIAVECKASTAPAVSRGFWSALDDLDIEEAWVVAPVAEVYPIRERVRVTPLRALVDHVANA
ncbi:MAG TPA: ATP-binding protein [Thermoanaerobaculia bacterium]|nr:ATP-binding protein [Thermoanaerobaculia bacterium]